MGWTGACYCCTCEKEYYFINLERNKKSQDAYCFAVQFLCFLLLQNTILKIIESLSKTVLLIYELDNDNR